MKKQTFATRSALFLFAALIFLSSCTSTTLIQSVPSGAKVTVDGERVVNTPYAHTDTKIVFSSTSVILEKEGYDPFATIIVKNEEPNVGAIVGGFFVWPIWLWALQYKATRTYELKPAE